MNAKIRKISMLLIGLTVAITIMGCMRQASSAATPTAPAATKPANVVSIDNFSFTPEELTITAGATVTWVNHDDIPHTIVGSVPKLWIKSPALDTDEKTEHTFDKPGTYEYFCSIHPHMLGKIIVK